MAFNLTPASIFSNALTAINLLTGSLRVDVVAVLDQQSSQQVFAEARPVKCFVKETSRTMDYPVETGAILTDHRVSNPTEIEFTTIISSEAYASAYQAIRTAFQNATLLSVQTRTGTYRNMIIATCRTRKIRRWPRPSRNSSASVR